MTEVYLQFQSIDLPSGLDGDYTLEFVGRDAGNPSSQYPNKILTGWFCKPSGKEYWAQVVEDGSMSWVDLFAEEESEEEDSPADWYESTERIEDKQWTVYRSDHFSKLARNHHVVIVKIDTGWHPLKDRPYAVLCQNPDDGGYYEGSYDLSLEQALEERQRRSKVDSDPDWFVGMPPKFRDWSVVNTIGEERLKRAFGKWSSATDKALVELLYAAYWEDCHSSFEFLTCTMLPVIKEIKDELTDFDHDWSTDRDWQELIRD